MVIQGVRWLDVPGCVIANLILGCLGTHKKDDLKEL